MNQPLNPRILGEAADWLVQIHSGTATDADHRAIEQWRSRSAEHALAWQKAEMVLGDFRSVPAHLAVETLKRASRQPGLSRRQTLTRLGLLLMAGPVALALQRMPWDEWRARERTAIGEQRHLVLPDGSQLVLNTDSSLDIAFSPTERRLKLHSGEILLRTAADPAPVHRPLLVETPHGSAWALGTQFSVRIIDGLSRVAVLEGAVEVRPQNLANGPTLNAGQQVSFARDLVGVPQSFDRTSLTWDKGMLVAQDMRLGDLLAELGRYRPGVLRCQNEVAQLRVSGAFPLRDTDASLRLLQDTLPLKVTRLTRYWVSVEPRV